MFHFSFSIPKTSWRIVRAPKADVPLRCVLLTTGAASEAVCVIQLPHGLAGLAGSIHTLPTCDTDTCLRHVGLCYLKIHQHVKQIHQALPLRVIHRRQKVELFLYVFITAEDELSLCHFCMFDHIRIITFKKLMKQCFHMEEINTVKR